jgi:hypothetical protein
MNTGTQTLYHRDGHEETFDLDKVARMASCGQVGAGRDWSSVKPAPIGWQFETPKYKATRDVHPAPLARYRQESPFENIWDDSVYQYGERPIKAGEFVETKSWPHPSFMPLNYGAERVLAFFNSRMKSRMTLSPWSGDRILLDDGLSFSPITFDVRPPQMQPVDLRPVSSP